MFPSLSSGFLHPETQTDFSAAKFKVKLLGFKNKKNQKENLVKLNSLHKQSTDVSETELKEKSVDLKFLCGSKYKTELCKNIQRKGYCVYGAQCCYSHDLSET